MIPLAMQKRRATVALVALLLFPPLAPLAWGVLSGELRPVYLRSWLLWGGVAVAIASIIPLRSLLVGDPTAWITNPQSFPMGPGLLLLAGCAVSTLLMTASAVLVWRAHESPTR